MTIDLRILKRYLSALLAAAGMIIVIDQAYSFLRPRIVYEATQKTGLDDLFPQKEIAMEPLQVFQEAVVKRNLFDVTDTHSGGVEKKSSIAELVKDYRLKGIALFTAPEGIIEDATTGRSVFVKEGEKLGPVTVKQIKGESIVLSHDGEEFELKIQGGEIQ